METHVEVKPLDNLNVEAQHQSVIFLVAFISLFSAVGYGAVMLVFKSHFEKSVQFPFRLIGRHVQGIAVFVFQHGVRRLVSIHVGIRSHAPVAIGVVKVHRESRLGAKPIRQSDVVSKRSPEAFRLVIAGAIAVTRIVKGEHVAVNVVASA